MITVNDIISKEQININTQYIPEMYHKYFYTLTYMLGQISTDNRRIVKKYIVENIFKKSDSYLMNNSYKRRDGNLRHKLTEEEIIHLSGFFSVPESFITMESALEEIEKPKELT